MNEGRTDEVGADAGRPGERVPARRVLGLAVPALGVLAAEPLYLLVDTAVVGHLGAVPLAALAIGGIVLAQVSTQLTFLSYGTTARAARLHGAGRRADAVEEGVQATWLAVVVGLVLVLAGQLLASPIAHALAGPGAVADAAVGWLRIALLGAPLVLITMAGNGWMRGVQDTARPLRYVLAGNGFSAVLCPVLVYGIGPFEGWGLAGSAVANVAAQAISAALFLRALAVERVPLRPVPHLMRAQLGLGRDLILRSLAFQACFVSAAAVAARTSAEAAAAHQVVLQLWTFLSLVLDSLAIAAQSLVGAALGSSDARRAKGLSRQITFYGLWFGVLLGVLFAALSTVLPPVFTPDAVVLAQIPHAWWFFVALQPIAGVVFALDGVLLGAGDAAYLRTATLVSAALGFLPLVWLSLALEWGLAGVWTALSCFMLIRLVAVLLRARTGAWAVIGATRP
ncbi:MATE family efflux transporter [Allokutzneria oryzae]|uniref:MATE family efflux transporter n=1 Tax=Allokutzneria oryzae TaxID=1378989 RepID=A0ABV6A7K3_9PSEU